MKPKVTDVVEPFSMQLCVTLTANLMSLNIALIIDKELANPPGRQAR